jgi:hypothetical protein
MSLTGTTENHAPIAPTADEAAPDAALERDDPRPGLRSDNRATAMTLVGIAAVMFVAAVGIAVLVLHFEAIHAVPKP